MMELQPSPNTSLTARRPEIRQRFDDEGAARASVVLEVWRAQNAASHSAEGAVPVKVPQTPQVPASRGWTGTPFNTLAKSEPLRLVKLVATGELAEHDLTYAAEALGLIDDANTPMVVKVLAWLSHHHSPIVREGVVYGLGRLLARSRFAGQVLARLAKDPSPEVRTAAVEALEV
jgi:hypothetical protein